MGKVIKIYITFVHIRLKKYLVQQKEEYALLQSILHGKFI